MSLVSEFLHVGTTRAEKSGYRLLLLVVTISGQLGDGTGWPKEVMEKEKTGNKGNGTLNLCNIRSNVMKCNSM